MGIYFHGSISALPVVIYLINALCTPTTANLQLNFDLIHQILSNVSDPPLRPVRRPGDRLVVSVSSALYQVVDMNQRNNLATVSAYFETTWNDANVEWDPEEFNTTYTVQGSTPMTMSDAAVQIDYQGNIRAFIPFTAQALCPINVKHFPFDTQTCEFKFGSWSYMSTALLYKVRDSNVYLGDFFDNQEWLLIDSSLNEFMLTYPSEKYGNETYSMVILTLKLQRQSFYYVFNLVIPVTLTSVVAVCGFHARVSCDARRTAKFRLGIMTLLSMGVMLLMVVDDMPKFALASLPGQRGSFSDVPLLGMLYIGLISLISISTCAVQLFVMLEGYALQHPLLEDVPRILICLLPKDLANKKKKARNSNRLKSNDKALYMQDDAEIATTYNSLPDATELMLISTSVEPFNNDNNNNNDNVNIDRQNHAVSHNENDQKIKMNLRNNNDMLLELPQVSNGPHFARVAPLSQPEDTKTLTARSRDDTANDKILGTLLTELENSLRQISTAVVKVSDELESASESLVNQSLQPHWQVVISRLECVSLMFFLGMIVFFLTLFNLGPIIY